LDYLFIALGFVATLIGTLGKTKDSSKEGFRSLRPLGWVVLAISATMVSITAAKTYQSSSALAEEKLKVASQKSRANDKLAGSLPATLSGLKILYRECRAGASPGKLDDYANPIFVKCLKEVDLMLPARDPNAVDIKNPNQTLAEAVANATNAGQALFLNEIQFQTPLLDKEVFLKASDYHDNTAFALLNDFNLVLKLNADRKVKGMEPVPIFVLDKDMPAAESLYLELVREATALDGALRSKNPAPG
jgi:hypothetical protein